ncbi:hypothetical protein [Bifidobacterium sp. SO1]|uniref:hypothetical protein n=1 Tax=Bifidobacterium sp. SO1 TaxID=2809029 RepID=UPI001BDC404A|nr:hypothetical protein [Bifidobacterium sp. SO1]MBT1162812.1 hypothetical protein [Bifidobacterium sp. SO1]
MTGLEAMWRTGVRSLDGSSLVEPGSDGNSLVVPLNVLARYAHGIEDGLEPEDYYYRSDGNSWHENDARPVIPVETLAERLNRSINNIYLSARRDIDAVQADQANVLDTLLHITRLDPKLTITFVAKERTLE